MHKIVVRCTDASISMTDPSSLLALRELAPNIATTKKPDLQWAVKHRFKTCPQQVILNGNTCHALHIACSVNMVVVSAILLSILYKFWYNFDGQFIKWLIVIPDQCLPINLLISHMHCTSSGCLDCFFFTSWSDHHLTSVVAACNKLMIILCLNRASILIHWTAELCSLQQVDDHSVFKQNI